MNPQSPVTPVVPQTPQVSLNPLNPLGLDLANPDVVQINGNIINTVATDNISLNAADSTYIYINVNGDVLSQEAADQLSGLGVKFERLVAKHTYLARYENSDLDILRALPFVRAANVFGPSLKTVATLKKNLLENPTRADQKVVVLLHPNSPQSESEVAQEISSRLSLDLLNIVTSSRKIELTVSPAQLEAIASIDSVGRIEEYVPISIDNEYARGILGANWDYSSYGDGRDYYRWKGRGEVVCVADTGVDVTHRAFTDRLHEPVNLSLHEPHKSENKANCTDPHGHGTHVAGSVVEGVAQECKILVQNMLKGGATGLYDTDDMYRDAWNAGAYIHTNSWGGTWPGSPGYQLSYNTAARTMDAAVYWVPWQDRVIVVSGGNDGGKNGWNGEIGANNAAKNAICVGNGISLRPNDGDNYDPNCPMPDARGIAKSSSTGPTLAEGNFGGRIKPDVIAPGTAILSCKSSNIPCAKGAGYKDGGYSWRPEYCYKSGTSMATPHVAGCCAVIREALISPLGGNFTVDLPSGMLIKALLINGCIDLKGHYGGNGYQKIAQAPSTWQGFGRVDLTNSLLHIERVLAKDPGTGYVDSAYRMTKPVARVLYQDGKPWASEQIICDAKVLSVTLAYYDEPDPVTQNKVTLTVYNGEVGNKDVWWYGNRWSRMTGPRDEVNTVEKVVWVKQPGDSNKFWFEVEATRIGTPGTNSSWAVAWLSHE